MMVKPISQQDLYDYDTLGEFDYYTQYLIDLTSNQKWCYKANSPDIQSEMM